MVLLFLPKITQNKGLTKHFFLIAFYKLFFSKCNDASGKSYRYNGLPKSGLEAQYEKTPPTTTPPPPMLPVPSKKLF
ncbi:hypothetical protein M2T82_03410 [Elizabethkingia ursingii]|uniref:hypothetical protein n=1 Tax=Elizabethkingia ursingii TaxID=1756150 RepID=UPI002011E6F2|nr:hypothetical protein [Elizabethkingia ursingii]MCL1667105.1 hypothetical protein [Elizabethkingia ursingii]